MDVELKRLLFSIIDEVHRILERISERTAEELLVFFWLLLSIVEEVHRILERMPVSFVQIWQ